MSAVEDLLAKWQRRIATGRVEEIDEPLGRYELEVLKVVEHRLRTALEEDRITLERVWREGVEAGQQWGVAFHEWGERSTARAVYGIDDPVPRPPKCPYARANETAPVVDPDGTGSVHADDSDGS